MTTRWLTVLLVVAACDAGRADHGSSAVRPLSGPMPRDEFVSDDVPTPFTIHHELGGWYSFPELHRVAGDREDRYGMVFWHRYYDNVELQADAITSRDGDHYITRFHPEYAEPERPDRAKLIGEAKALAAANMPGASTPTLFYVPKLRQLRLAGTTEENAMNFTLVIESWRLLFRVDGTDDGVDVDAYTGEVVNRWSNMIF